jgi:hypothetical protein
MTDKQTDEDLINHIRSKAMQTETPLIEAVDALKAISGYRTMQKKKGNDLSEDEPDDEPSFDTFREGLQEANKDPAHGVTPLRSHRRTRSGA